MIGLTRVGSQRVRRRGVVLTVAVATALCVVGLCLIIAPDGGRSSGASDDPAAARVGVISPVATGDDLTDPEKSIKHVTEPQAFVEAVAHALFDWDTARPLLEYSLRVLAVADPTGAETSGLVADVAAYLPSSEAWTFLKPYYTRQWIEIDSIETPTLWEQARAEAGPSGFAPGTTALTVRGVRHRSGVWEGDDVWSSYDVAFTVFVVCQPSYPSCHLLRLSRLDEPLD